MTPILVDLIELNLFKKNNIFATIVGNWMQIKTTDNLENTQLFRTLIIAYSNNTFNKCNSHMNFNQQMF